MTDEHAAGAGPPPLPRRRRARPSDPWGHFTPVLWLLGALLACYIQLAVWGRVTGDDSPWPECVGTVLMAAIVCAFALAERRTITSALHVRLPARAWLLTLLVFVAMALVVEAYFWAGTFLFETETMLEPYRKHGWPPWSAVLLVVVCPAFFEELAFRGFLLARLAPLMGERDAWLLQGSLFAIMHLSVVILPSHFVMGLALGFLRLRTTSLVPGMLVHAAWNLTVLMQEGLLRGW